MKRRDPKREMSAWKTRVDQLLKKEARCPACAKAKRQNEGTLLPIICNRHMEIRAQMAFE